MDTNTYYKKKEEINSVKELTEHQKEVLIMDLRTQYYAMDRSGLNHMDSANFKKAIIKVI